MKLKFRRALESKKAAVKKSLLAYEKGKTTVSVKTLETVESRAPSSDESLIVAAEAPVQAPVMNLQPNAPNSRASSPKGDDASANASIAVKRKSLMTGTLACAKMNKMDDTVTKGQKQDESLKLSSEDKRKESNSSLIGFYVDTDENSSNSNDSKKTVEKDHPSMMGVCPFSAKSGASPAVKNTAISSKEKHFNALEEKMENGPMATTTEACSFSGAHDAGKLRRMTHAAPAGAGSCPFRSSQNTRSSMGSQRPADRRASSLLGPGFLSQDSKGENTNKQGCPFFVGAADRNAALMLARGGTTSNGLARSHTCSFDDDEHENWVRDSGLLSLEYSYTNKNLEFPNEIQEEELFGHPTKEGFMSREHGFMVPDYENALDGLLNSRGRIWYNMGCRMEGLKGNNGLVKAIEEMKIVEGDEVSCPDESLQLASAILSHLANGYRAACWRNNVAYEPSPAIQVPWQMICDRLGRKDVYVAPEDLMYQQRPIRRNIFEFDNIEMITPIFGTSAESLMSKLFCESNRHLRNMMEAILALARGEWKAEHISTMIAEIKDLTRMLSKAIPDGSAGSRSIDPVEFATAFANATAPLKEGVPALSGGGCPIFVIMDHIIGRSKWDSTMGADLLMQVEFMPRNWRRFIEFLRQKRLFEKVPDDLTYLWMLLKDSYCGERGWLGKHKYRAYQFVELAGALGRTSNKGSDSGADTIRMLEESRRERDPSISDDRSSYKTCLFKGTIRAVTRVSEDRITRLVTIDCSKVLALQIGDHVAVVMKNNDDTIWEFASRHNLDLNTELTMKDDTLSEQWKERLDFDGLDHTVYNLLSCAKLSGLTGSSISLQNLRSKLNPEEPRLYSYATVHPSSHEKEGCVSSFDILVTRTNAGGCSAFLHESVGCEISFGLSTATKCHIPTITTRPLVVIAAGSGLGTYLPLLVNNNIINPKYAFLAYRTENTVPYLETHLKEAVNYGKLQLFVELSREDRTIVTSHRALIRKQTKKRYIDQLLRDQRELIRELAAPIDEGGMEASFYVCGNNEFFKTVRLTLEAIDDGIVNSLVHGNRLQLEVQARGGLDGKEDCKPMKLTETCFHNKMNDFWTIIDGTVYDFTEYLPWHPGGRKILHYIAGTDCTEFWKRVSHDRDRMVYSQIAAYEVGPFDASDPDGLMAYLEFVTRCENCVNLYKEKDDLFKNLCDSYSKVQNVWESIVGPEFFELLLRKVEDKATRRSMFKRIFHAKHGSAREISNHLYSVAPIIKGLKRGKAFEVPGVTRALRPVKDEERLALESRLISTSNHFFTRCKCAIVETANLLSEQPQNQPRLYSKLFYRLIMSFEELYSSLAQPMPLRSVRCWDVVKEEILTRQTFNLRFSDARHVVVPEEFEELADVLLPEDEHMKGLYFDELFGFLELEKTTEFREDNGIASSVINHWFAKKEIKELFDRLDSDQDGLVSKANILNAKASNHAEAVMLYNLMKDIQSDENLETLTYKDFLLASPELSEKRKMIRVSSLLMKGMSSRG